MDDKNENYCMGERNTGTQESKCSVATRLDRLETEINLLLMLSANNSITKETNKIHQKPEEEVKEPSMCKDSCTIVSEHSRNSRKDNIDVEDEEINTTTYAVIKLPAEISPVHSSTLRKSKLKKTHEKFEDSEKMFKKLKKKKSICMCKKKRSKSSLNYDSKPHEDKKQKIKKLPKHSKSADLQILTSPKASGSFDIKEPDKSIQKPISKSCPSSSQNIEDLCSLIVDLKKNQDLGSSISDEWKSKCLDIQNDCNYLKTLQLQTDAQKKFLNICYQTELKHRKMLESFISMTKATCEKCASGELQLDDVKKSLEEHKMQNEELLFVCNELRHELALSEERLRGIQQSSELGAKLDKEILDKFESNSELMKSQAVQKDETFKKQIKEHLNEIEELRLTCAKNAQWACEESSIKTRLLKENTYLHKKLSQNQEKQQKHMDYIKILRKVLLKIGEKNPKVKKLVQALDKYEWDIEIKQCDNASTSVHAIEVINSQIQSSSNPDEAKRLIQELNEIIRQQNSRIQELVDITSSLAIADSIQDRDSALSCEQALELVQAKNELEDVKERYYQLICTVKDMKKQIKHLKQGQKAVDTTMSTDYLENEVSALSKQNKQSMTSNVETIDRLTQIIDLKTNKISKLQIDLQQTNGEKNNLISQIKALEETKETLRQENNKMRNYCIQQNSIIDTLEKQFQMRQHEIVLQKIAIDKEKKQAIRAAQFATDKLMETMVDYHEESKSQILIRDVLTRMLQEKDDQLRDTIDKVGTLTLDPRHVVEAMKKKLGKTSELDADDENSSLMARFNHHYGDSDEVMHALMDAQISSKSLQAFQTSIAEIVYNSKSTEIFEPYPDESCPDYEESERSSFDEIEEEDSAYMTPQLFTLHTLPEENEDQLDEDSMK